jgi:hypothetical protein
MLRKATHLQARCGLRRRVSEPRSLTARRLRLYRGAVCNRSVSVHRQWSGEGT